ncbi:MAG: biopolymer transporter ExbD [Desulfobacterota bacterium]|jgi:biopolymer transport protein ExbD|nr:biopolymer transporter ExbD [Thermodesulfobacteriota bacterium]
MALGRRKRRSREFIPPKLQMTSMMDMFTILLIFLLVSFSKDVVTMKIDGKIQLPKSNAQADYQDNVRLVVSENNLWLGSDVVAEVRNGKVIGLDPENLQGSVLYQRLKECKKKVDRSKDEETDKNLVLFLCDKRLSFKTINSIIKTAGMAGFPNFQFGVLKQ